jgi:NADH:ubiquinone oxidoreductase subunit 2 (subunit N)
MGPSGGSGIIGLTIPLLALAGLPALAGFRTKEIIILTGGYNGSS